MNYDDIINDAQVYLPLQEASGTIAFDASENSRNGVLSGFSFDTNSTSGPTSWLPKSLETNGISQLVEIADHPDLRGGGQVSLCGWVKQNDEGHFDIISKGTSYANKDWNLGRTGNDVVDDANKAMFLAEINNSGVNPKYTVGGGWLHLASTYDNVTGLAILYVNGEQAATQTSAGRSDSSSSPVALFRQQYNTSNSRYGQVAGVGMWNRILTPLEVLTLYQGPIIALDQVVGKASSGGAICGQAVMHGLAEVGLVDSF